ncbi:PAS domain-containing protein [Bacteroidota bacterium]
MKNILNKTFFVFFLPIASFFVFGIVYTFYSQKQHGVEMIEQQQLLQLELHNDRLNEFYAPLVANVNYLAGQEKLLKFLVKSKGNKQQVEQEFALIAEAVRGYDQIRILDTLGIEVLRINHNEHSTVVLDDSLLQDKSDRFYFKRIMGLDAGMTYVGRIDLNMEHGVIEKPLKPVIRVGKKVYSANGKPLGVVITNYDLRDYLSSISTSTEQLGQLMLLDTSGHWLAGPAEYQQFGQLFPKVAKGKFSDYFQEEWNTVAKGKTGTIRNNNGLFLFNRFVVNGFDLGNSDEMIFVIHIPNSALQNAIGALPWKLWVSLLFTLSVLAWISYIITRDRTKLQVAVKETLKAKDELQKANDDLEKIVTERTRSLQESEKNFRTIFETIDSGLVYQDAEGNITNANKAAERILGLTMFEMMGRTSIDPRWRAMHPDGTDFPGDTHPPMMALKTGKEIKDEIMGLFHPKTESYVWIKVSAYPVFENGSDKPVKVFSTFEDISDTYLAKLALDKSEKRFKLSVSGTKAGIWEWLDVNKDEEWWSPQFYHLLGYEDQEIPATLKNFEKLLHPDDVEKTFAVVKNHFAHNADFNVEYRLKTKSGAYRWFLGSGQAEWDDNGNPITMVGSIVDIEDKKSLEFEMEHKVEERTNQLALINQELESFSYSVSHDLRAPLRAVNSFAQILHEDYYDKLDDEGKDTLNIIRDNAKYMGKLIDDLLQFSRLGRQDMAHVPVSLCELSEEVLFNMKQSINLDNYKIDIQKMPRVNGDRDLLKQVVVNLLSNAIKYSSKNPHPTVVMGATTENDVVTYFVKDNGVGFNMDYADKLFGVFQRLHTQEEFEGTGVGLAIAHRIIKRHGGKLWAESELNKGATFFFQL